MNLLTDDEIRFRADVVSPEIVLSDLTMSLIRGILKFAKHQGDSPDIEEARREERERIGIALSGLLNTPVLTGRQFQSGTVSPESEIREFRTRLVKFSQSLKGEK